MRRLIVVLLGMALAAAAQSNQQAASTAAKKKIHLEGRVLSVSGDPLRRASVRLQSASGVMVMIGPGSQNSTDYTETTDDEGKFVFEDVAAGRYTLIAERAGYVPQRYGARSISGPGTPLNLVEGQEMKDLVVKLTQQGVIVGKVVDQDGDAVANATIKVQRYTYNNGRRQLTSGTNPGPGMRMMVGPGAGNLATDDQGNFRVSGLAPGRYYVSVDQATGGGFATLERTGRAPATPQRTNVATFYPSSLDIQSAAPIDLTAGGEFRGVDIQMRRERTYAIRGKTTDAANGSPLANTTVMIIPPDNVGLNPAGMPPSSRTAADGSFEMRSLLPGTYTIQASNGGTFSISSGGGDNMMVMAFRAGPGAAGDSTSRSGRIDVTIGDTDINNAIIPLSSGMEITGSVKFEGGELKEWIKPGQQADPSAPPGLPPLPGPGGAPGLRLATSESISINAPSTRFNEDGSFVLKGVAASKYFLTVTGLPSGSYVKSIRMGGRDMTKAPLDLSAGASGSLDIIVSKKSAEYSGTVKSSDGKPQPGATVSLWPRTPNLANTSGGVRTATTDQNGSFKIDNVVPGDYYISAWDSLPDNGIALNPDFLSQFASAGNMVQLGEGAKSSGDAKLIAEDKILAAIEKIP